MMLLDPETGVILHANRAARIFYGYPDLSGMNISRINTLSPEEIYREMQRARSQKENHFNFRHRLADGSVRDVEVYSYAVTVEGRDLLYTVVIDRTEVAAALGALKKRTYGSSDCWSPPFWPSPAFFCCCRGLWHAGKKREAHSKSSSLSPAR